VRILLRRTVWKVSELIGDDPAGRWEKGMDEEFRTIREGI